MDEMEGKECDLPNCMNSIRLYICRFEATWLRSYSYRFEAIAPLQVSTHEIGLSGRNNLH